jgi:hypothetical protein
VHKKVLRYRFMLKPWPGCGPFGNLTTFSGALWGWDWLLLDIKFDDDVDGESFDDKGGSCLLKLENESFWLEIFLN